MTLIQTSIPSSLYHILTWNHAATPCLSPHILIQKMDLWQQSSNNRQSASFMNLALPQEVKTEKSFNFFLKRITGLHFSSSSRVLKCTVESEKGARL